MGRGVTPASLLQPATAAAASAAAVALPAPPASVAAIKAKLLHDKEARLAQEEAERAKKERLALALAVPKVVPSFVSDLGPLPFPPSRFRFHPLVLPSRSPLFDICRPSCGPPSCQARIATQAAKKDPAQEDEEEMRRAADTFVRYVRASLPPLTLSSLFNHKHSCGMCTHVTKE